MSGSDNLVYWECNSSERPPADPASLLKDDETLLWSARLSSTLTARQHLLLATFNLIAALLFAVVAPWNQTVAEYCGSEPAGRCRGIAYIVWPALAFAAVASLWNFWSAWRAICRPWMIAYGLSDRRAFFLEDRRPNAYRSICASRLQSWYMEKALRSKAEPWALSVCLPTLTQVPSIGRQQVARPRAMDDR